MRGKMALYAYLYGLHKLSADYDDDLDVDSVDCGVMLDSWGKGPGDAGYDWRADLYETRRASWTCTILRSSRTRGSRGSRHFQGRVIGVAD